MLKIIISYGMKYTDQAWVYPTAGGRGAVEPMAGSGQVTLAIRMPILQV